jgi:hypothetical protein
MLLKNAFLYATVIDSANEKDYTFQKFISIRVANRPDNHAYPAAMIKTTARI